MPVLTPLEYLALAEAALLLNQTASGWTAIEHIRRARDQMLQESVRVVPDAV